MNKNYIDELCGLFLQVKNKEDVLLLLKDIITPHELESLSERLQIFKLLAKKMPQRKISEELKISISKVTRGSHAFKKSKSIVARLG